ncbi:hypothetical protein DFH07DRAFT_4456 [Mycena maculata]|uniref:Uncharacterized protein n=1 Tax=Mycena maculata TaxID=230809 RepID=A0AAD7P2R8_9AGAR|nr:hypothetical protein DFH07DRAFT_4456 [Mycena maculata]
MLLPVVALVVSLPLSCGRATQIPFSDVPLEAYSDSLGWANLGVKPNANGTEHLIFDTVNSLLQHWPNTRYRNGHNVVPGIVPVGTLLYHGRENSSLSAIPDWTATDPEHSFPFCGSPPLMLVDGTVDGTAGCWQLTLVTTRPLKVLYLDGSSAANMQSGTLDVQDLLLWGKVSPERWLNERERINGLCEWGKDMGIDGYVRMEMDFEIMLCDFHNGVDLLSADFLSEWSRPLAPFWPASDQSALDSYTSEMHRPSSDKLRTSMVRRFETIRAGSWHNRFPGETRVTLDLTRLVSFYDTALVPSLTAHRVSTERWDHRLHNISSEDLAAVTARLHAVLAPGNDERGSGIDWQTLFRVVVDRYGDRLEMLEYLLNTTMPANAAERAQIIQMQLRVMITPYILHAVRPGPHSPPDDDGWAAPVWRGCATRHTAHIHASAEMTGLLTPSEHVLLRALEGTNREICRVITRMWAAGVRAGFDVLISPHEDSETETSLEEAAVSRVLDQWRADAHTLLSWLDWSVWVKCRPACTFEETCYLPTWPWFLKNIRDEDPEDDSEYSWKRPQPRCIRQFEPYSRF